MLEEYGIKVVKLDLPFRLNHVNCFIAEGDNGIQVIDAGLHNEPTVKRWEQELHDKQVTDIIITHYHPDHFGYAGGLQKRTGAKVHMSRIDAEAGLRAWEDSFLSKLNLFYELSAIPEAIAGQMIGNTKEFTPLVTPYPEVDHYLAQGKLIPIGKYEYEVIFTPGHSDGLVSFYNQEKSILLSTDHILPKITPNISYWFHGDPNPLRTYMNSLEKLKVLDVDLVVPSHGKPFHGVNDRIEAIMKHHEDRLAALLDSIRSGSTVYEACSKLFRKQLTVHEMRFAIGETIAHLEYLREADECKREMRDGKYWYTV